jgi:hypothetical protein
VGCGEGEECGSECVRVQRREGVECGALIEEERVDGEGEDGVQAEG